MNGSDIVKPLIYTKNLHKTFKSGHTIVHAVNDTSITVNPGELTILKGRSGSGKTTLMNLMSGLDRPDSGEIYLNDEEITGLSDVHRDELRRKDIGIVFQSVALISMMSAYENVEFNLRISGYKPTLRKERAEECLHFVGLGKRMKHRPAEMSGGEQQRVAIARALASKPKIIFADEPTGELDTHTGLQVMKLFKQLVSEENTAVLMTTHDPKMMELADKVYTIEDGVIVDERK